MFRNTGIWNKQKTLGKVEGYKAIIATDKYTSTAPNTQIKSLEKEYEMVGEQKLIHGIVGMWELNDD